MNKLRLTLFLTIAATCAPMNKQCMINEPGASFAGYIAGYGFCIASFILSRSSMEVGQNNDLERVLRNSAIFAFFLSGYSDYPECFDKYAATGAAITSLGNIIHTIRNTEH